MISLVEEEANLKGCLPFKKRIDAFDHHLKIIGGPRSVFQKWVKPTLLIKAEDEKIGMREKMGSQNYLDDASPSLDAEGSIESAQSINSHCQESKSKMVDMHPGNKKYLRPYKKLGTKSGRGWLETSLRMGVIRHELFLTGKRITKTDTDLVQHRFQLTIADVERNSSRCLQKLGRKAREISPPNGVAVKVLDRMGRTYNMVFKYVSSSHTYRFMGADYSLFLVNTGLRVNQFMEIWGLRKIKRRGHEKEIWLAFINSDERIEGKEKDGESVTKVFSALPTWNVLL